MYKKRRTLSNATICISLFDKLFNSENQPAQLERASLISHNCQVWLQNIVKCGKHSPVKFENFVYFCITNGKALPLCGNVVTHSPAQYKSIENSQNLHYYIFDILQYFTTKLHNVTKFRKLFPTVLKLFSNFKVCLIGEWSINYTIL